MASSSFYTIAESDWWPWLVSKTSSWLLSIVFKPIVWLFLSVTSTLYYLHRQKMLAWALFAIIVITVPLVTISYVGYTLSDHLFYQVTELPKAIIGNLFSSLGSFMHSLAQHPYNFMCSLAALPYAVAHAILEWPSTWLSGIYSFFFPTPLPQITDHPDSDVLRTAVAVGSRPAVESIINDLTTYVGEVIAKPTKAFGEFLGEFLFVGATAVLKTLADQLTRAPYLP